MNASSRVLMIGLLMAVISTSGTAQFAEPVYGIHPSEQRFLRYNYYTNVLDSVKVSLKIGEFAVREGNSRNFLFLEHLAPGMVVDGDSTQGRDELLASYGGTTGFQVPKDGCTLQWWRMFECNVLTKHNGIDCDSAVGYDARRGWKVGTNKMQDQSEFRVELCSDENVVIAVIDSFGVHRNPESEYAGLFGGAVDGSQRSFIVPKSLAGTMLHCRIVPYRYGSTPFGMEMVQFGEANSTNLSASEQIKNGVFVWVDSVRSLELEQEYKRALFAYTDSCIQKTGHMPANEPTGLSMRISDEYLARYYTNIKRHGTITAMDPKYPSAWEVSGSFMNDSINRSAEYHLPSVQFARDFNAHLTKGDSTEIVILNGEEDSNLVHISLRSRTDLTKIYAHCDVSLHHGANRATLDIHDVDNGQYLALVQDKKHGVTISRMVSIEK